MKAEEKKVVKKSKTEKVVENTKKTPVKKTEKKTTTKSEDKVSKKKGTEKADKKVKSVKAVAEENVTEYSSKVSEKSLATHQRIIQHSLEMAGLKPNQCRWPIGDPDSEGFHFCGETVFVGKPYCYEHCKQAYQFAPPKKTSGK